MLSNVISKAYPDADIPMEKITASISGQKQAHGDISSSISFMLAKKVGKAPKDIAKSVAEAIEARSPIMKVENENGYINAYFDVKEYSKNVLAEILEKEKEGASSNLGSGKKALVEFPSVNPSKPWHIGHLRNALLGDSIANIMERCGYKVERDDYIEDLGLQIAESIWGYMNLSDTPDKKFDQWLGEQYVKVNKLMKEKDISGEINGILKNMENLDTKESKLAREVSEKCVDAQYQTAFNYGISHDLRIWESDIVRAKLLEAAIDVGMKKGVLHKESEGKYAGCIVVDLEKMKEVEMDFKNPAEDTKVLIRSNGTATYSAKDLAFHMWKFGLLKDEFHYSATDRKQRNGKQLFTTAEKGNEGSFGNTDIAVNVIGSAQRYSQLILKALFSLMGYPEQAKNIMHVAYGEVALESGSLSGRSGGWIGEGKSFTADSLMDEAKNKVREKVAESSRKTKGDIDDNTANVIAAGAIKFEFLKIAPEKILTFSWDKALDFGGNSGPYCMYMYTRAGRIIEKAGIGIPSPEKVDYSGVDSSAEFGLIKLLSESSDILEKACAEYRPNVITDYLIDVSSSFSKFYETSPVLNSGKLLDARVTLVAATMSVIKDMLRLLGIDVVDRM